MHPSDPASKQRDRVCDTHRLVTTDEIRDPNALSIGRDRLIAVRLAEFDEPCTAEPDGAARTTTDGYNYVVMPTFKEVEETTFRVPFDAACKISTLIEGYERHGLAWGVIGEVYDDES